jgi:hypothetical protein
MKFSLGPNGNWILTLPHICLLILLNEMLCRKNFTTCTMHAVSLSNLMDFSLSRKFPFSRKFSRNFVKIVPFSHDFRISQKLKNAFSFQPLYEAISERLQPVNQDCTVFNNFEIQYKVFEIPRNSAELGPLNFRGIPRNWSHFRIKFRIPRNFKKSLPWTP